MYIQIRIWLTEENEEENNLKNHNSLSLNYLVECPKFFLESAYIN